MPYEYEVCWWCTIRNRRKIIIENIKNTVTIEDVKANMQDVFVTTLKPFDKLLLGYTLQEKLTNN